MWMLTTFTEEKGGTRAMLGSHRLGRMPPPDMKGPLTDDIVVTGKPGSVAIFGNTTWHTLGRNRRSPPQAPPPVLLCPLICWLPRPHSNDCSASNNGVRRAGADKARLGLQSTLYPWYFARSGHVQVCQCAVRCCRALLLWCAPPTAAPPLAPIANCLRTIVQLRLFCSAGPHHRRGLAGAAGHGPRGAGGAAGNTAHA